MNLKHLVLHALLNTVTVTCCVVICIMFRYPFDKRTKHNGVARGRFVPDRNMDEKVQKPPVIPGMKCIFNLCRRRSKEIAWFVHCLLVILPCNHSSSYLGNNSNNTRRILCALPPFSYLFFVYFCFVCFVFSQSRCYR